MKVSIVIPNYNGEELLEKNLPHVIDAAKAFNNGRVEIIVVDDGSTDASASVISNFIRRLGGSNKDIKLKMLKNKKNLGFSLAVNKGVESADGDIIVLLNTDVRPEKNFLEPLVLHFSDSNVFAVGCLDKSIEGKKRITRIVLRGRGVGEFKRGFLAHRRGEVNKTDTLWVSGGSGAFKKNLWLKLGGFDPLYKPFYWEDIDLSYRALKSGYKIIFAPKSIVVHEHETGSIRKHYQDFKIKIVSYRNQFIFVWKNITDPQLKILHFMWLPVHIVLAFFRGDLYFLIGFFLALSKLPKIMQSSSIAQKLFVKKDREVLESFA